MDVQISVGDGSDSAAWAQAMLSGAAIIFSGLFAVAVPIIERRLDRGRAAQDRLSVTTRSSIYGGVVLIVAYKPRHLNVGVEAKVRLRHKAKLGLIPGKKLSKPDPQADVLFAVIDDLTDPGGKEALIRLTHDGLKDSADIYTGAVFIRGEEAWDKKSVVDVQIWTDAAPRMLTKQRFAVSPID